MIIRARPRYYSGSVSIEEGCDGTESPLQMYFVSGRAALKFYLKELAREKTVTVAMQSFNCRVVADAVLEADCSIYLLDIGQRDCSITLDSVQGLPPEVKVLLLTHYQGMPNVDYERIAKYCIDHGILLIEDLAHVCMGHKTLGQLSDANIYSFAFDKPLSCGNGGMLELNRFVPDIYYAYLSLPIEKDMDAERDLRVFDFMYKYSSPSLYHRGINNYRIIEFLMDRGLPMNKVYFVSKLFGSRVVNSIFNRLISTRYKNNIKVIRMSPLKVDIVLCQAKVCRIGDSANVGQLLSLIAALAIRPFDKSEEIEWNRFSLLDPEGALKELLSNNGIEVGNFNWPLPLNQLYDRNPRVNGVDDYYNSEFASQHILNIPLWSEDILKIELKENNE